MEDYEGLTSILEAYEIGLTRGAYRESQRTANAIDKAVQAECERVSLIWRDEVRKIKGFEAVAVAEDIRLAMRNKAE